MKRLFSLFWVATLTIPRLVFAMSSGVTPLVSFSSPHIDLHDQLHMQIVFEAPSSYRLDEASLDQALEELKPFLSVVETSIEKEELSLGRTEWHVTVTLEPWEVGETGFALLPLRLNSTREEAKPLELYSDWYPLSIELPKTGAVVDWQPSWLTMRVGPQMGMREQAAGDHYGASAIDRERKLAHGREQSRRWITLVLIGLCVALLFLLALKGILRLGRRIPGEQVDKRDLRRSALEELEALVKEDLPGQGLYEPYFVRITSIVRCFLEAEYTLRAPERTTQEFLEELVVAPGFDSAMRELLQAFLLEADLVKFARFTPTSEDCHRAVEAARRVIEFRIEEEVGCAKPLRSH